MAVYAKKLSPGWREAFDMFEKVTGFEVMHQDAIDDGEMTAREAWDKNIEWLEGLVASAIHIQTPVET